MRSRNIVLALVAVAAMVAALSVKKKSTLNENCSNPTKCTGRWNTSVQSHLAAIRCSAWLGPVPPSDHLGSICLSRPHTSRDKCRYTCRGGACKRCTRGEVGCNCRMGDDESDRLTEGVLQHRPVAFSRATAIAFVESCWELIADDPDVWYWSEPFIVAGAVEAPC